MEREDWRVKRTGADIAKGAGEQLEYRRGRLKVWEEKKAEVMAKVKETGLTVHEDIAEQLYKLSTGVRGQGATIMVDRTMQEDLNRCVGKISEHREAIKEYEAWIPMLAANPEQQFELAHTDWVYFFGR